MSFRHLQESWLIHLPWQLIPELGKPFCEEIFSYMKCTTPLAHLDAISSCLVMCNLGAPGSPHLATPSFHVAVENDQAILESHIPQAKHPKLPQPLFISFMLFYADPSQLCCPALDMLQGPQCPSCSEVSGTKQRIQGVTSTVISTGGQSPSWSYWPRYCWGCHLPFWAHSWLMFRCCPPALQSPFLLGKFPDFPQAYSAAWGCRDQRTDLALCLVEHHRIDLSGSIWFVQVPIQSLHHIRDSCPTWCPPQMDWGCTGFSCSDQ